MSFQSICVGLRWAAVPVLICFALPAARAQSSGVIQGHVTSPSGLPLAAGTVRLTIDRTADPNQRAYSFSFPLSGNGDYRGTGIVPAVYMAVAFSADGKLMDSVDNVHVEAGKTSSVDFDMTRQSYIDAMSAADRKTLEDFKEKNKAAIDSYLHIRQADGLLLQARQKEQQGQFDQAVSLMQSAISLAGDQPLLWYTLGEAQLGIANASAATGKKRRIASVPELVKQYDDALASYRKALDLNGARSKPSAELAGAGWNQIAGILGKLSKTSESVDAYNKAIAEYPAGTGFYALNEAVTAFNAGDMNDAAAAAARAIEADPTAVEAYYLKGKTAQEIMNSGFPAGTRETARKKDDIATSYGKYLALAPKGTHADEARIFLAENGYNLNAASTSANGNTPAPSASASAPVQPPAAQAAPPQSPPASQVASASQPVVIEKPVPAAPQPADRGFTATNQPPPPAKPSVPIPHNYALIFGTDTYAHWPSLQNPISDADALNETLTSLFGFQVEELKNPTGEQIVQKLREYLHRHFQPQDQLMIVFSGHGYFDDDLGQGFLTPSDALRVDDDLGHRTLLAHETVMNYVNRIPSTHVLLVIDACFAGTLDRRIVDSSLRGDVSDVYVHATLPELLQRKENKRTRRYFASGGKDFVPDGLPGHHSPFISALLVTLNRAADQKGYATLDDLQQGLNTVNPEPRWGDIQGDNEPGADFLLLTPAAVRLLTASR